MSCAKCESGYDTNYVRLGSSYVEGYCCQLCDDCQVAARTFFSTHPDFVKADELAREIQATEMCADVLPRDERVAEQYKEKLIELYRERDRLSILTHDIARGWVKKREAAEG
jgi:hypothetical protein